MSARGLSGVKLVTSDAHRGLTATISATLPAAGWQRYRTRYAVNLGVLVPCRCLVRADGVVLDPVAADM